MNILKKLLIITLILIFLIVFAIFIISKKDNNTNNIVTQTLDEVDKSQEAINQLKILNDKKEYLNIKKCLTQYMAAINKKNGSYYGFDSNNNYTIVVDEKTINTNIYNVLSKDYIEKNSINIDNVRKFVYDIQGICLYIPIDIEKKIEYENVKVYAIYGVIENISYEPIGESYLILSVDENNQTFSVQQVNSREELNNIKVSAEDYIENKGNNIYSDINGVLNENLIKDYILTYKSLALAYPEIVYNKYLDDEYKKNRFESLEDYKKYVADNKDIIISINPQQYKIEEKEEYTQYIAIDKKGKYYIFNSYSVTDYRILLDNYTVDLPEFLDKYNNVSDVLKVGYNIEKCIEAINNKDYKYVYNKLDDTFKSNNYKTLEKFSSEIKSKLFDNNEVKMVSYSNEGNTYIYKILIKDTLDSNNQKNMTIIMQLKEGTDFVMSFSF